MLTGSKLWRSAVRNLWNAACESGDRRRSRARRKNDALCLSPVAAEVEVLEARRLLTAGAIDTTFGSGGMTAPVAGGGAGATAVQSDGKTIVTAGDANTPTLRLYRYTAGGALDTSFGTGGSVVVKFGADTSGGLNANSVTIQADGKILVAGGVFNYWNGKWGKGLILNNPVYVARFNANGTLDTTFGNATKSYGAKGEYLQAFNSQSYVYSMAIDPQGRIVASARLDNGPNGPDLLRLNSNGTLDTTFATNGIDETGIGGAVQGLAGKAMLLQPALTDPSGYEIVAGGYGPHAPSGVLPLYPAQVARFHSNGTLDNSFGSGGVTVFSPPIDPTQTAAGYIDRDAWINALALEADGSIVAGGATAYGTTTSGVGNDPFVAHLSASGTLDTSFGNNSGFAVNVFSPEGNQVSGIGNLMVDAGGNILAGATATDSTGATYATLMRYTSTGQLDTTFGVDGTGFVFAGPGFSSNSIGIEPDGKLIVSVNGSFGFRLIRYLGA